MNHEINASWIPGVIAFVLPWLVTPRGGGEVLCLKFVGDMHTVIWLGAVIRDTRTPSWAIFSSHLCPSLLLSLLVTFTSRFLTPETQSEDGCLTLRTFTMQPFGNSYWYFATFPINSNHLLSFPRYCCMEKTPMAEKKWWQPPVSWHWENLHTCALLTPLHFVWFHQHSLIIIWVILTLIRHVAANMTC